MFCVVSSIVISVTVIKKQRIAFISYVFQILLFLRQLIKMCVLNVAYYKYLSTSTKSVVPKDFWRGLAFKCYCRTITPLKLALQSALIFVLDVVLLTIRIYLI